MRRWVMIASVVAASGSFSWAAPGVVGLASPDEKVRLEASAALAKSKATAVPGLLAAMEGDNPTAAKMAEQTLFQIVQAAAGTADQASVAVALVKELAAHKPATARLVCEHLGFLGPDEKAAEALSKLLTDKELRESARMALVRMAGPASTAGLVGALAKSDDEFKLAIVNGLGQKGDPAAAGALAELVSSGNDALKRAAWQALAQIPAKESVGLFKTGVVDNKDSGAIAASLDFAETLLKAGMLGEADQVLKFRKAAGPVEGLDRCRMLRAHARIGTPESISLILSALDDTDLKIRGAAYEAAATLPGTEVTRVITQKMNSTQGPAKLELLALLGKRGRQMDERTVMLMYMAMLDKDEAVKVACIRAMQDAGVTATLPTLVNLVRGPAGPVADAAEQALSQIPGPSVTASIVDALQTSTPEGKVRLLRPLQFRADPAALPAIMREASGPDPAVRAAAYRCLGRLASEEAYDVLLAAFDGQPGPDRDAAEQAMMSLKSDLVTAKLLSGYFSVSEGQKPSILRVLAARKMEAIDALLLSEATSPDDAIREAAVRGLSLRSKPALAPTLLAAAKAGPAPITAAALDGYLNIATSLEKDDGATAAGMYTEALKLAAGDEQRRLVLLGLGRVGDPAAASLVSDILPLMSQGNAQDAAAMAVAGLAARMPDSAGERAKELLRKVADESKHAPARQSAIRRLRELGVDIDPAAGQGFITKWWLLGPVDRHGDSDWDRLPDVLKTIDVAKPTTVGSRELAWKAYHSADPQGLVDLLEGLAQANSTAAYAYTEVTAANAGEALLKVGSDDGIAVWVNGEKVHSTNVNRPVQVDQDVVKVSLKAGKNTILARIQQGSGTWGFCARLVTPDGKPVSAAK